MSDRAGPGFVLPLPAFLGIPVLLSIAVGVPVALQVAVGGSIFPQGWMQLAVGVPVVAAGLLGNAAAGRTMQKTGTSIHPDREALQLVTHGPFRFSRNPLTVTTFIFLLGIALVFNGAWLLLMPLLYGVFWVPQAKREERYLEQRFGEQYLQYKQQVRRWI